MKKILINKFWQLIEPSIDGYSKAIDILLNFMDEDSLAILIDELEDGEEKE